MMYWLFSVSNPKCSQYIYCVRTLCGTSVKTQPLQPRGAILLYKAGKTSNALPILTFGLSIKSQSSPQASRQHSYSKAEDHYFPDYTLHTAFAWSRQPIEKYAGFLLFLRIPENTHSCHWPCCFHIASFSAWKLNYWKFKRILNNSRLFVQDSMWRSSMIS